MSKRPSVAEAKSGFKETQHVTLGPPPVVETPPDMGAPADVGAPVKKGRAASREGKKLLLTPVDKDLHKSLKRRAIDEELTVEALVQKAIKAYLSKSASTL